VRYGKILLMGVLMLSTLFQTGCWSKTELPKLTIATAIGVDINENKEIELSLQLIKPRAQASGQAKMMASIEPKQYVVINSKGKTFFDADMNLQNVIDRKVTYSNVMVIIIGEKLAKEGISEVVKLLQRQIQIPPYADVLVAVGSSAKDILEIGSELENIPAVGISNIEKNFNECSTIIDETLIKLIQDSKAVGKDTIVARVYKKGPEEIAVEGCALFKGYKLIGWLDDELTRGYRFAKGDMQSGTENFKSLIGGNTIVSMKNVNMSSKIKVNWVKGKPEFIINIQQSGSIIEMSSQLNLMKKGVIESLEEEFSSYTKESVTKMINFIKENSIDIIGLGNLLYKFHYGYWKQVRKDWVNELKNIPITINVQSTIERAGFLIQ